MKKLHLALSAIGLLAMLAGCGNIPTTVPTTTAMPPSTTAAPVSMPNIVELEGFLVLSGSWHKKALTSLYESPKDVDLFLLFRDGFDDEPREYTDEETALLRDYTGFLSSRPLIRLPEEKMDAALQEAFGLTLAETHGVGLEHFVYLPDTGCYYTTVFEEPDIRGMSVLSMKVLEDNCLRVRYTTETAPLSGKTGILTLRVNADGTMQILSNLQKNEPATGDPDPFANLPLDDPEDYAAMFAMADDLDIYDTNSIKALYRRDMLRDYFQQDPQTFLLQLSHDTVRVPELVMALHSALQPEDRAAVKDICYRMKDCIDITFNERQAVNLVLERLLTAEERSAILETELEGRTEITDYTAATVRFAIHPGIGYHPTAALFRSHAQFAESLRTLMEQKDNGFPFDPDATDALCPESFRTVSARFDEAFFKENVLLQIYTHSSADTLPEITSISGKEPDMIVGSLLVNLTYNQPVEQSKEDRLIWIAVPRSVYEQYAPDASPAGWWPPDDVSLTVDGYYIR